MKIIKILLSGVGLILLLAVITVAIFLATFDANQYKQDLAQLVKQQTGRELLFHGDIGLSLYPALGMKLGSLSLSNAPGFGEQPMLAVKNVSASVDILSLFALSPEIAQLDLDGLSIDLQKNSQGVTNWDDLLPAAELEPPATPTQPAEKKAQAATGLDIQGAFGGLNITNAQLKWSDASSGVSYRVDNLSAISGRIAMGQAFPLSLGLSLQSQNEFSADLQLTTNIMLASERVTLSSFKLGVKAQGELFPVDRLELTLVGDVDFSLASNQLSVTSFNTHILTSGGVLQRSDTNLAGEIGFDLNQQQLVIGVLDLRSDLQDASVPNGRMQTAISASKLELQIERRSVALEDLVLALNENRFKGFVRVADYAQPAVSFDLASERFDVDKLMGVADMPEVAPVVEPPAAAEDIQIALPMELLRSLKLDGRLEVATLISQGLTLNDVSLKMAADKGIIDVKPIAMRLYEGGFDGAVRVNAKGEKPVYTVSKKLTSFKVGAFLKDFMGDAMVSGEANLSVDLTTQGEWLSELKSALNGQLDIRINNGALTGFNLRHSIDSARARLRREPAPALVERKTDFSALSLSGKIVNGVFSSDDLDMQAPLVRVGGRGSADLVKETVDYRVDAKLVTTAKGQQGGMADELAGLLIPVAISGSWLSPKIDVQLDEMLKAKLKADKDRALENLATQKAAVKQTLDAQKAKLKEAQLKEAEAKKLQMEKQQQLLEAEKKAELDAKKKAAEEAARKKAQDKLKKLF